MPLKHWIRRSVPVRILLAGLLVLSLVIRKWPVLSATTHIELKKRYAGSAFGILWVLLYPALLLSIYIFVYMVIFKIRIPEFSELDYVLFVFAGLVPYLSMMEALSTGTGIIKQNMHMVKNVMLPIDLIPVRSVMISMISLMATIAVLLTLAAWGGKLTLHVLWLPVPLFLLALFFLGLVYIVGSIGVVIQDINQIVGLVLLLLMFLSPIGYRPSMVPDTANLIITLNPVYYITEVIRCSVIYGQFPHPKIALIFTLMCLGTFLLGAAFFRRFKNILVDYE